MMMPLVNQASSISASSSLALFKDWRAAFRFLRSTSRAPLSYQMGASWGSNFRYWSKARRASALLSTFLAHIPLLRHASACLGLMARAWS